MFRFKKADLGKFNTAQANEAIKTFSLGCRIIGLTMGNFSLIDLIHAILQKTGTAHVIVATWSAGIKDAHQAEWMLSTNLIQSFRLITDHSYVTRQKKYAVAIEELFGKENIRTSEIHAKFCLIHNDSYKIAIRSSMNLNANRTCETFEIDEDKEIFDFFMDYVESTFGDMPKGFVGDSFTANKALEKYFNNQKTTKQWWSEI